MTRFASVDEALDSLAAGEVIGLPTDTVYGLGALATSPSACRQIFELKGRPAGLALPVLVFDLAQAKSLAVPSAELEALAHLWPGPLTIVTRRQLGLDLELGGDEQTIGLRCPDHDLVRDLARRAGPLAVTSANRHREEPAHSAAELAEIFGERLSSILDGGTCNGEVSTVAEVVDGEVVIHRQGPISLEQLKAALTNS